MPRRTRPISRGGTTSRAGRLRRPGPGDRVLRAGDRPRSPLGAGLRRARELHWVPGFLRQRAAARRVLRQHWNALRASNSTTRSRRRTPARHAAQGARLQLARGRSRARPRAPAERGLTPGAPALRHQRLLPRARVDEALSELEGILRIDPLSLLVRWWLAVMAYLARKPERVIAEGRHMIALDASHFLGHWRLASGSVRPPGSTTPCGRWKAAHALSGGMPFTSASWRTSTAAPGVVTMRNGWQERQRRAPRGLLASDDVRPCPRRARRMGPRVRVARPGRRRPRPDHHADQVVPVPRSVRRDTRYGALLRKMRLE